MVGQHPRCASLPELKLFAYDTIGQLEASLPVYWSDRGITHRSPGLVRAIAHFEFGAQDSASMLAARAWLRDRSDWSGAQVFDVLLTRLSPRLAVEKSPENVEDDAALQRLAASYPQARFMHLTRHPVTTQQSLGKHLNHTIPGFVLPGQPAFGIAGWVSTQCRILAFAATLPESRYLRVRAEDVLNDPHSQLASIASWLELETSPDAIEAMLHPERSPFARPGPIGSGVVGGNDPAFLADPVPHRAALPPTVEPPEGWVENSSLWEMTLDIAARLGYP
jgi:Sulfotransferase family